MTALLCSLKDPALSYCLTHRPFELLEQLTLSLWHEDLYKCFPPTLATKPRIKHSQKSSWAPPLHICASLLLATAQALHPTAGCYAAPEPTGMILTPQRSINSLGKQAVWIWQGGGTGSHAVMLFCLLGNASGRHRTHKRERR